MMHQHSSTLSPESTTLRIGTIPFQLHYSYWTSVAQGITARATELGIDVCTPTSDLDTERDAAIQELIDQRPQVVIVTDNLLEYVPFIAQTFSAAGIACIGVEAEPNPDFACVVRADEAYGATAVITYLFDRLDGFGKVVHIGGGYYPTHRQRAFHQCLQRYPRIQLVHEGNGYWNRATGADVMRAALKAHPDIRGVFAENDLMAVGATDVIAEWGVREQIVVAGYDADPEGLIAIHEEHMLATVYRGQYGLGRTAVDMALRVARGEQVDAEVCTPTHLITAANLVDATLDLTYILPGVLRDFVTSGHIQRQLQQQIIAAQRQMIEELSTPVIPISDSILIMPLIGAIDSDRAEHIIGAMLQAITQHHAQCLLVDITGIAVVDTMVAQHLMQAARAVQLLGARIVLTGIRPEVAQTLVGLGVDLRGITTHSTLQRGMAYALSHERRA